MEPASGIVIALGLVGCPPTQPDAPCPDARLPVHQEAAWDPNRPLVLAFAGGVPRPADAAGLLTAVRLTDAEGAPVPYWSTSHDDAVYLCPKGGLRPASRYAWTVDEMQGAPQSVPLPPFTATGLRVFTTAPASSVPAVDSAAACHAAAIADPVTCHADLDVIDTGGAEETGASDTGATTGSL